MSRTISITASNCPSLLSPNAFGRPDANKFLTPQRLFVACLAFIVSVSIYDCYLVAIYRDFILYDERNPICEMLIQKDPNHLSWFMTSKFFGNLFVLGTLLLLRWILYRQTLVVTIGVASFQFALLLFLTFSDPLTGLLHFDDLYSPNPIKAEKAMYSVMLHLAVLSGTIVVGVMTGIKWKTIRNNSHSAAVAV